jgi:hypothetical protein
LRIAYSQGSRRKRNITRPSQLRRYSDGNTCREIAEPTRQKRTAQPDARKRHVGSYQHKNVLNRQRSARPGFMLPSGGGGATKNLPLAAYSKPTAKDLGGAATGQLISGPVWGIVTCVTSAPPQMH